MQSKWVEDYEHSLSLILHILATEGGGEEKRGEEDLPSLQTAPTPPSLPPSSQPTCTMHLTSASRFDKGGALMPRDECLYTCRSRASHPCPSTYATSSRSPNTHASEKCLHTRHALMPSDGCLHTCRSHVSHRCPSTYTPSSRSHNSHAPESSAFRSCLQGHQQQSHHHQSHQSHHAAP